MTVLATAWVALLGAGAAPRPPDAAAAGGAAEHRVAVIVDTGTLVKSVCVRFAEESITGIEALQRASVDPVTRAFAGKGAAVCSLCGTGCPADESCLTCDAGGRFWSYSRATAGTSSLRASGVGASSTAVRDGDVEGWRWGVGGTPAFASVEQVCGQVVPAATSTTAAAAAVTPPPAGTLLPATTTATTVAPGRTTATSRGRGPAPRTVDPAATPTVTASGTTSAPPATTAAPTSPAPDPSTTGFRRPGGIAAASGPEDDGGRWTGLAGFAAALTGLLAWSAVAKRRRRGSSARR